MASIARTRGVGATALSAPHFLLLYSAMLVASSGNTALQSVMPAIGREIGIGDFWVAISYTWSAVLWVAFAPNWAEKSDHHGRKTLTIMGVTGFIVSMLLCGIALFAGLKGWIGGVLTFGLFAMFRAIYGGFGCATPSATQAYLASAGASRRFRLCPRRSAWGRSSALLSRLCLSCLCSGSRVRCLRSLELRWRSSRRLSCGCRTTAPGAGRGTARR